MQELCKGSARAGFSERDKRESNTEREKREIPNLSLVFFAAPNGVLHFGVQSPFAHGATQ